MLITLELRITNLYESRSACRLTHSRIDKKPISDEIGLAAEGVCSIGILMCVRFVNVFTAVEELWEGFETARGLPWVAFHGCFMQLLRLEEHGS